eukprot:TRINITY_DN1755_c0_g1_i3.p3 TRINITY_DN1755_c0_g1~~TRINITY_DN1755_c0_g1_i3.p3  ORF type:complete len:265 (+),score=-14.21 TRINITY_DN1755_c0_g1_i3:1702-2496(+)
MYSFHTASSQPNKKFLILYQLRKTNYSPTKQQLFSHIDCFRPASKQTFQQYYKIFYFTPAIDVSPYQPKLSSPHTTSKQLPQKYMCYTCQPTLYISPPLTINKPARSYRVASIKILLKYYKNQVFYPQLPLSIIQTTIKNQLSPTLHKINYPIYIGNQIHDPRHLPSPLIVAIPQQIFIPPNTFYVQKIQANVSVPRELIIYQQLQIYAKYYYIPAYAQYINTIRMIIIQSFPKKLYSNTLTNQLPLAKQFILISYYYNNNVQV